MSQSFVYNNLKKINMKGSLIKQRREEKIYPLELSLMKMEKKNQHTQFELLIIISQMIKLLKLSID